MAAGAVKGRKKQFLTQWVNVKNAIFEFISLQIFNLIEFYRIILVSEGLGRLSCPPATSTL